MTLRNDRNHAWANLNEPEPHQLVIQLVDPNSRWWFSWAKTSEFPAAIYLEVDMRLSFVDNSIQGIVVEAGPTASGKSSLLIGMINFDDLEIF
jgi:type II secretory ATPase GspE/PulE/Tfp pilus assembly ATPase PilB-like protein